MDSAILAFGSLFLGLVTGSRNVELMVSPPVTEVEIRLDGEEVGRLQAPPWRLAVDFGPVFLPHRLEAVGRDADGNQVALVSQRVNLPRSPAEVEIILRHEPTGEVSGAQLRWQMSTRQRPHEVRAELDGSKLEVTPEGTLSWAPLGPGTLHFLKVQVEFPHGVLAQRELAFGTHLIEDAGRTLTGTVAGLRHRGNPTVDEIAPEVLLRGSPARVVGIEKGPVTLVLVFDPTARDAWWRVVSLVAGRFREGDQHPMPGDDRVMTVSAEPTVQHPTQEAASDLFPVLGLDRVRIDNHSGILRVLVTRPQPFADPRRAHLADAIAVAGLLAAGGNQRRAVVFVLGDGTPAASTAEIASVRGFLDALRVPLVVWSPIKAVARAAANHWGVVQDTSTLGDFYKASNALHKELSLQRVVWVEGDHLPQDLSVAPSATTLTRVSHRGSAARPDLTALAVLREHRQRTGGHSAHPPAHPPR